MGPILVPLVNSQTKNHLFLKYYGHMENSLHRLESSIPTDLVEDVLWVSSCLIMVGTANASLTQKENYMLH